MAPACRAPLVYERSCYDQLCGRISSDLNTLQFRPPMQRPTLTRRLDSRYLPEDLDPIPLRTANSSELKYRSIGAAAFTARTTRQEGDVPRSDLLREVHAAQEVLKARVGVGSPIIGFLAEDAGVAPRPRRRKLLRFLRSIHGGNRRRRKIPRAPPPPVHRQPHHFGAGFGTHNLDSEVEA